MLWFLIRALTPAWGVHSHDFIQIQLPLNAITLGVKTSTYGFEGRGAKIFSPQSKGSSDSIMGSPSSSSFFFLHLKYPMLYGLNNPAGENDGSFHLSPLFPTFFLPKHLLPNLVTLSSSQSMIPSPSTLLLLQSSPPLGSLSFHFCSKTHFINAHSDLSN